MLMTSVVLTVVGAMALGIVYPLVITGVSAVAFPHRADGSIITKNGVAVGSSLIGQNFLDNKGNPDKRYFQSRPSAAGAGYDALASAATNYGPGDPRLVEHIFAVVLELAVTVRRQPVEDAAVGSRSVPIEIHHVFRDIRQDVVHVVCVLLQVQPQ